MLLHASRVSSRKLFQILHAFNLELDICIGVSGNRPGNPNILFSFATSYISEFLKQRKIHLLFGKPLIVPRSASTVVELLCACSVLDRGADWCFKAGFFFGVLGQFSHESAVVSALY